MLHLEEEMGVDARVRLSQGFVSLNKSTGVVDDMLLNMGRRLKLSNCSSRI